MDEQQTRQLILQRFGVEAVCVEPMTLTHSGNSIFGVTLSDGREIIVRMRGDESTRLSHTVRNIEALSALGLPTPVVIVADVTRAEFPFAYVILEKIRGRDLLFELPTMTRSQMTRLAEQVVELQRRVTTLPQGTGFGWGAIGEGGPEPAWLYCLPDDAAPPENVEDSPASVFCRRLFDVEIRLQPYFRRISPTCFLEDLTTKNVLLEQGELVGLIDFDEVCFGDPLWQVGLAAGCIANDVGLDGLFYTEELCRFWNVTEEQRAAITYYTASRATEFLDIALAADDLATARRLIASIEDWLTILEG